VRSIAGRHHGDLQGFRQFSGRGARGGSLEANILHIACNLAVSIEKLMVTAPIWTERMVSDSIGESARATDAACIGVNRWGLPAKSSGLERIAG
jgi:hypothetical protein